MGSSTTAPKMTLAEFHRIEAALRQELLNFLNDLEPIGSSPEDTDVWDGVKLIDSKLVVTELRPLVKEILDVLFPLKFVRKGGYDSSEEAVNHLLPQIRKWCTESVSNDTEHSTNGAAVAPPST